jgi:glycine hydroxymethyltransferase
MKEGAFLVSGGTDNHIILLDLRPWNLTGKEAEKLLEDAGMNVNKNTIPYDPKSPFVTSGIRMGTVALTKRGMREEEMKKIGEVMVAVLKSHGDKDILNKAKETTTFNCEAFPIFA